MISPSLTETRCQDRAEPEAARHQQVVLHRRKNRCFTRGRVAGSLRARDQQTATSTGTSSLGGAVRGSMRHLLSELVEDLPEIALRLPISNHDEPRRLLVPAIRGAGGRLD